MRWLAALGGTLLLLTASACGGGSGPTQTPTPSGDILPSYSCVTYGVLGGDPMTIQFDKGAGRFGTLVVEVADTPPERAVGLMNRECLNSDAGMIFAWHTDTTAGFWMKDTKVPLSIAFIQADGKIVHMEDMQPETTNNHASPNPYRYALEVNQGWFASRGIAEGDTAIVPESVTQTAVN